MAVKYYKFVTIQNSRESRSGFEFPAPKWMVFIHFVCIGIARCPVTVKVLNSYINSIINIRALNNDIGLLKGLQERNSES